MPERNDRLAFASLIAALGTTFGDSGMPKAKADIYYEFLKDISIDALKRAVDTIIRTRKYSSLPTIAEIREAALGRDEDIDTASLTSWGRACQAVERGCYPLPNDDATNEAVRVAFGGWEKFGQTDPESAMADRAHFLKVFRGLARQKRDRGERALPPGGEIRQLRAKHAEGKRGDE